MNNIMIHALSQSEVLELFDETVALDERLIPQIPIFLHHTYHSMPV